MKDEEPRCPHCGGNDRVSELRNDLAAVAVRRRRQAVSVLVACCLALIPWIVYLAFTLPAHYESQQWRYAWVGFDSGLLAALAATAYFGRRRSQAVVLSAVATAVLLVCDAWFDVMLARGTGDLWLSLVAAFVVELPLAGFLLNRSRRLLQMTLRVSWYRAGLPGEPPPLRRAPLFVDPARRRTDSDRGGA